MGKRLKKYFSVLLAGVMVFSSYSILSYAKTEIYSDWSDWSTTPVTEDSNTEVETKTVSEYWRTRYDYDYYCTWYAGDSASNPYVYSNTGGNWHYFENVGSYYSVYSYTKGTQAYPPGYYRNVSPGYILSAANGELPGNGASMSYCKNGGNQVGYALRADQSGQTDNRNQIVFLVNSADEYKDVTYYRYRTNSSIYSITYDANGGQNAPSSQEKTHGTDITLSSQIPEREGYSFLGWAPKTAFVSGKQSNSSIISFYQDIYSADLSTVYATPEYQPGDTYSKNADITLYAVWQGERFVYYNANGGQYAPATQTYCEGETIKLSTAKPKRDGYIFKGWAESPDAEEATYQPGADYSGETTTLYAVWTELGSDKYLITYNANGGEGGPEYQIKNKGEPLVITDEVPTRYGYNFNYWSSTSLFSKKYYPGDTYTDDKSITLNAQWTSVGVKEYTVERYLMDTNGDYQLVSTENSEYTLNETVTADYTLEEGFYLDTENSVLSGVLTQGENLVLKVYIGRNKHTLTFDDGTNDSSSELYFGAPINVPDDPEKSGFDFLGWSEDGESVASVEKTMPDRDLDYTALFSGHDWSEWTVTTPAVEPTCTEKGKTAVETRSCNRCHIEETRGGEDVDALMHSYQAVVTAPTCTEQGYTTYTCIRGDNSYVGDYTEPLGHDWSEWMVTTPAVEPTCTKKGKTAVETRSCNRCHIEETRGGEDVDALTHSYQAVVTVPTCTEQGYTTYTCIRGDDSYVGDYTEPLGHDWGEWKVVTPATCEEKGSEQRVCKNDSSHIETRDIEASGHKSVTDAAVAPTCTETGLTEGSHCSVCNKVLVAQEVVAALGHDYDGGVITTPATCTEDGVKTYTCRNDASHKYTEPIAKTGHDWGEWITVKEATIDEKGQEKRICKNDETHIEYRDTDIITSYTATFVVVNDDGSKTIVDKVRFMSGASVISEPAVPQKGSRYIGYWEDYTLSDKDIEIKAVYELKSSDNESELETDKNVVYEDGIAKITLSAFAETLNAKVKYGAVPTDIILVLDTSGSMNDRMPNGKTRLQVLKEVSRNFVGKIAENAEANGVDHRIAIVSFASEASLLTGNRYSNAFVPAGNKALISTINGLSANGATRSDYGLDVAKRILANNKDDSREKTVVFLTDGVPTYYGDFIDAYANSAISTAGDIKKLYGANIYSVGVSIDASPDTVLAANPSSDNEKMNAFMHYVSSNYPNSTQINNGADKEDDSFFITADNSDTLASIFDNIVAQKISNTITFSNITVVDTVSKYFTLTQEQETALRSSLVSTYGVSNEQISVVRNDDGTTTLRIENISPKAIFDNGTQTGYGITVTYEVSANENAIDAGFYSVTEDNGYLEKDGTVVAQFNPPADIEIDSSRYIVKYVVDGEVYAIEETAPGAVITPPQLEYATFAVGDNTVATERVTTVTAENNSPKHSVKWIINGNETLQQYREGQVIVPPEVNAPEGYIFVGWNDIVPYQMESEDLEFSAVFIEHTHRFDTEISGSCETGVVTKYTCSICGYSYSETAPVCQHNYCANIVKTDEQSVASIICSNCGDVYQEETVIKYVAASSSRTNATVYDLNLTQESTNIQPDGTIVVKVSLDNDALIRAGKLYAYRIENGVKHKVEIVKSGTFAYLYLDHFSYYVIAKDDADVPEFSETVCAFNGHTEVVDKAVPATYTSEGKTEGKHCSVCGEVLVAQKPVAKLTKKANTLTVKAKKPKVKFALLKKKKRTIALKKWASVSGAQGAVTYKLTSAKKGKKSFKKYFKVAKNGKITVKKGLKKGKYKVKIKVTAAGNGEYDAKAVTVTVTIRVK